MRKPKDWNGEGYNFKETRTSDKDGMKTCRICEKRESPTKLRYYLALIEGGRGWVCEDCVDPYPPYSISDEYNREKRREVAQIAAGGIV